MSISPQAASVQTPAFADGLLAEYCRRWGADPGAVSAAIRARARLDAALWRSAVREPPQPSTALDRNARDLLAQLQAAVPMLVAAEVERCLAAELPEAVRYLAHKEVSGNGTR